METLTMTWMKSTWLFPMNQMWYKKGEKALRLLEEYIVRDSTITIVRMVSSFQIWQPNNMHFIAIESTYATLYLITRFSLKNKLVS